MNRNKNISKMFAINIITIVILFLCLCVTTYAATRKSASAEGFVQTGEVQININDGIPVIKKDDVLFEPGMTIKKNFFVKNEGSCDVYFKVYLDNVSGELADILNIKILDGTSVLFDGTPNQFTEFNTSVAENILKENEKKDLTIVIHYPEICDNLGQGYNLTFDLCAKAVQSKNNVNKDF